MRSGLIAASQDRSPAAFAAVLLALLAFPLGGCTLLQFSRAPISGVDPDARATFTGDWQVMTVDRVFEKTTKESVVSIRSTLDGNLLITTLYPPDAPQAMSAVSAWLKEGDDYFVFLDGTFLEQTGDGPRSVPFQNLYLLRKINDDRFHLTSLLGTGKMRESLEKHGLRHTTAASPFPYGPSAVTIDEDPEKVLAWLRAEREVLFPASDRIRDFYLVRLPATTHSP